MDADATSALHKKGVSITEDSSKFTWFQVREAIHIVPFVPLCFFGFKFQCYLCEEFQSLLDAS